jgi:hypothetical protein
MTELILRTVSRLPLQRLARPSAVLAFALPFAYLSGLWLIWLHIVEGGHERNEPSLPVHALRDGTVALPLICVAVWAGVLVSRRLIARWALEDERVLAAGVLAVSVAVAASMAQGLTNPAHASLFGAHHGGHEPSLLVHMLRDGLLALLANGVLGAVVSAALLRTTPWALPDVERWLRPRDLRHRYVLQGALALLFIAPLAIMGQNRAEVAAAGAGPGLPCPSQAPLKSFDVQAIDVDIPLNRFGDHDPLGKMYVLSSEVAAVRAEEQSRHVSIGLRDDPIQPLVIRANLGDCVEINFTNNATGGDYGAHIDGLAFNADSSGDNIGNNDPSSVARGQSRTYRFWVPRDPDMEGAHYLRPGPGFRDQVSHGLFGSLAVEPAGSTYRDMITGGPIESGWQADVMPADNKAFREYVQLYHEVGNETYDIPSTSPDTSPALPRVDPNTESYRPGARAINYRSEPFIHRLNKAPKEEADAYGSYSFADPATPMPRGYQADPTKIRILHSGTEMFHVFHLHGGGIRWRLNPHADHSYDYTDTGLNKYPKAVDSASTRLDAQAIGPGESYDLEIEGGAGGVQQGAGEFLFHCHIAEHYVSGMWSFWRVFDTLQPDLKPLPDRAAPPAPVTSEGLIGKTMADGTTLTAANLDQWIKPQLPPQGVPLDDQDSTVWNYAKQGNLYLGEPEDKGPWPDLLNAQDSQWVTGHPGLMAGDVPVGADDRPEIKFNPVNGRPAFPLMRPHIGHRPPFSANGHSGAPYLGETGDQPKTTPAGVPDPWADRKDGICPAGSPVRHFNIVAIDVNSPVTSTQSDPDGKVYVLARDVDGVLDGTKPITPLAIRGNIGDCIAVTLTNKMTDARTFGGFSKVNIHIHHVQFDTQASDGVITGLEYEMAVRPYAAEDDVLADAAHAGDSTIHVTNPDSARSIRLDKIRPGVAVAVGEGKENIEIRTVASRSGGDITFTKPLEKEHASGDVAGTEFVQERWYPDVQLDNIFWHDHVDGIHSWGHGLVGQLIIEPKGSTYHDPTTGAEVDSGALVDIHTDKSVAQGLLDGSFRELALWTLDENPVTDSTLNLRAEPFANRPGDPSQLFSSYAHGDPHTQFATGDNSDSTYAIPEAYAGDPFVIRSVNAGPSVDTLHVDGHRFFDENRFVDSSGKVIQKPKDTLHIGVSERFTSVLQGGAGGVSHQPGDYLFYNGISRRFQQGAWSILRVLDGKVPGLQALPGHPAPANDATAHTGATPPADSGPGNPCPGAAPDRTIAVSAVDVSSGDKGVKSVFVPTAQAASAQRNGVSEPFVAHVATGDCLTVIFTNQRAAARASFHVSKLDHTVESSGVDAGYDPEQTVAPGATKTYRYYVDDRKLGSVLVDDMADPNSGQLGMYGAIDVAPLGATFTDPVSGAQVTTGAKVDVHVPGSPGYRDFTLAMADQDPIIGGSFMPYPTDVKDPALINYKAATGRGDDANTFSSRVHGDPSTPVLRAYAGDPTKVHFLVAPGSEQMHVFNLGGQFWPFDPEIPDSQAVRNQGVGPYETYDAEISGGAGGLARTVGDFFYGDMRRPFTMAGMWGLMRVMSDPGCPIRPLDGLSCKAQESIITDPLPDQQLPRPGEPAGGFPDNPSPGALAATAGGGGGGGGGAAAGPGATASGASTTTAAARRLRIARRLKLRTFAVRGMTITVDVPGSTKLLDARLVRRVHGRLRTLLAGSLKVRSVPRSGRLVVRWKPGRRAVSRLLAGSDTLRLRVGRDRRHLGAVLSAPVRLVGPRVHATAGRRR